MKRGVILLLAILLAEPVCSWNEGSVLLRDIQVLTLYKGRYTTGRRSSPVPQLQCVGGSAGCHAFVPEVVQCQNKGWDGVDVQWECKTDMDNSYRFGRVEVSCEGYNHQADPYVLTGSCGLEYSVELTEEGRRKNQGGWGSQRGSNGFGDFAGFASNFFNGFSGNKHHHQNQQHHSSHSSGGDDSSGLLVVAVLLLIAFGVYKLFLSGNSAQGPDHGQAGFNTGPDHHGSPSGPPPPGFKDDYTSTGYPGGNPGYGFRNDYTQDHHQSTRGRSNHNTGGGFWTGMGTGGLLGYLFGRQRNQPHHSYGGFSGNNSYYSKPSSSSSSSHTTSSSSGTRTASGFGGTKRR